MTSSPDEGIHPFRIDIPQGDLDDLHERLDRGGRTSYPAWVGLTASHATT